MDAEWSTRFSYTVNTGCFPQGHLDSTGKGTPPRGSRHGRAPRTLAFKTSGTAGSTPTPLAAVLASEGESTGAQGRHVQGVVEKERPQLGIRSSQFTFATNVGAQRYAQQVGIL